MGSSTGITCVFANKAFSRHKLYRIYWVFSVKGCVFIGQISFCEFFLCAESIAMSGGIPVSNHATIVSCVTLGSLKQQLQLPGYNEILLICEMSLIVNGQKVQHDTGRSKQFQMQQC